MCPVEKQSILSLIRSKKYLKNVFVDNISVFRPWTFRSMREGSIRIHCPFILLYWEHGLEPDSGPQGNAGIAERNVPVLHVAARLSDNFMPLMSSNWIAVLLISTFFTSSLKTDSSNNSSGGVLESFFWMSLVFCRIFSDVLDISFRESCCFLSLICCSMAALRSINCGSSI